MSDQSRAFAIHFHSLHFPRLAEDANTWAQMGAAEERLLEAFCDALDQRMAAAREPQKWVQRLQGSIFACCLPNGYAMLLAQPDGRARTVDFTGFYLRTDESLRTAWHLVRWQLLFLCAGGWNCKGTVAFTPEEINQYATASTFPQSYQNRLLEVGMELLQAEVPYSFAMTDCPAAFLPLQFNGTHGLSAGDGGNAEDGAMIYLPPEDIQRKYQSILQQDASYAAFRLVRLSQKQYLTRKVQEVSDSARQKQRKEDVRAELSNYHTDAVWCLQIGEPHLQYTELLNPITNEQLTNGAVEFADLYSIIASVKKKADAYFASVLSNQIAHGTPEESGGFLSRLHRK